MTEECGVSSDRCGRIIASIVLSVKGSCRICYIDVTLIKNNQELDLFL